MRPTDFKIFSCAHPSEVLQPRDGLALIDGRKVVAVRDILRQLRVATARPPQLPP